MAKEFKDWVDEFVENGANPKNVIKWPEEAGGGSGTKVVNELPQVGEEHIIYELQKKKIIPSLIPMVNQQMIDDGIFNEIMLFVLVFDTSEDMTNTFTSVVPGPDVVPFGIYIIKEDKLIMSSYADAGWQFAEATKVSDYKFDLSSVLGEESPIYFVILKEYLGKSSEESGDVRYTGKLLNDELYTFGANTFCIVLGTPTSGMMTNACMESAEIPEDAPKELIFEYIPYEKIIKELEMQWIFKPKGIGEVTISSYWIYTNETWFNADEIRKFKSQEKTVIPSTSIQPITPDEGYDGLSKVIVKDVRLQNKTVSATNYDVHITPDKNYDGLRQVTVNGIHLQEKTVSPTTSKQYVACDVNFTALSGVNINAIRLQNKTVSPTKSNQKITPDTNYDGLSQVTVNAIRLQDKTVSPQTTYSKDVTADIGYDGLREVRVDAVTSAIDSNIKAENIKKDVSILGVTGTYEGSGEGVTYTVNQLPNNSFTRYNMSTAQVGGNIYLFGGMDENASGTKQIYKFDQETEKVKEISTKLPITPEDMGTSSIGSIIYLFGAFSSFYGASNNIYKFDTETETLTTLTTTLPQKMYSMGTAQVGSNTYLFGGRLDSERLASIYKFDTETETLTTLTTTLPKVLSNMGVAVIGNIVYLFGGVSTNSSYSDTIYKFDTKTETITTLTATLPQGLSRMAVGQIGNNVYLLGGGNRESVDTVYKFNTETETVSTLPITLPITLSSMGSGQIGSNIYLFSGSTSSSNYGFSGIYKFKINF